MAEEEKFLKFLKDVKTVFDVQIPEKNRRAKELETKQSEYKSVRLEYDEATERRIRAERILDDCRAGILAEGLIDGEKCPVCGSVHHPEPAVLPDTSISEEEFKEIVDMFSSFGVAEVVTENLIDAVVGVSGSSPAFVYMFIEALADGAVLEGLPRDKAIKMAAQAVLGSAKMVLETGEHPGKLKDNVCSPAGTTIEAVYALEKNNFRGTVIEAVHKAAEKNRNM